MTRTRRLFALGSIAATAVACNAVLGIDDLPDAPPGEDAGDDADTARPDSATANDGSRADDARSDARPANDAGADTFAADAYVVGDSYVPDAYVADTYVADGSVCTPACVNQACVNNRCVGVCAPGTTRCTATTKDACDANGQWQTTIDLTAPTWTKTFGTAQDELLYYDRALQRTSDGHFVAAGASLPIGSTSGAAYMVEFGQDGVKAWERTYPGAADHQFMGVAALANGLVACGSTGPNTNGCTAGRTCAYCVSTDPAGAEIWEKTWPGSAKDMDNAFSVTATAGGLVTVGPTTDPDPWLDNRARKFDTAGNVIWEQTYSRDGADELFEVREAADGTFYGSGYTDQWRACEQPYVLHFAANGAKLGEYPMGPCTQEAPGSVDTAQEGIAYAVLPLADGSVIAVGREYVNGMKLQGFMAKVTNFDTTPQEVWRQHYGGAEDDIFFDVQLLPDGGFLLVGRTASYGAGGADVYVVRTDANGTELWHRAFGGAADDQATSIEPGFDGSYVVGGWTGSQGAGGKDIYALDMPVICP